MKTSYYLLLPVLASAIVFSSCSKSVSVTDPVEPAGTPFVPEVGEVYFTGPNSEARNAKASLGRRLFYDKRLSAANHVSCGSCHKQEAAFGDNVQYSMGTGGQLLTTNTTSLLSTRRSDLASGKLEAYLFEGSTHRVAMGFTSSADLAERVNSFPEYRELFRLAFNSGSVEGMQVSDAMGQFLEALLGEGSAPGNVEVVPGDRITATKTGIAVNNTFTRFQCGLCHGTTARAAELAASLQRNTPQGGNDAGAHVAPSLDYITMTAPYMNDGRYSTLEQVIEDMVYDAEAGTYVHAPKGGGGKALISAEERKQIVTWVNATAKTGATDVKSFADPFRSAGQ